MKAKLVWVYTARKAIIAGVIAASTAIVQAAPDGITVDEWLVIVGAAIVGFSGVYKIRNVNPPADPSAVNSLGSTSMGSGK